MLVLILRYIGVAFLAGNGGYWLAAWYTKRLHLLSGIWKGYLYASIFFVLATCLAIVFFVAT